MQNLRLMDSSSQLTDRPDEIALGFVEIGKVHSPSWKKHAKNRNFAADPVGPFLARLMIGPN